MMRLSRCAAVLIPVVMFGANASADTISYLWTFEDQAATAGATGNAAVTHPGALTSLSATFGSGPNAITVTITRVGGAAFDIMNNDQQYAAYTNPSSASFVVANQPGKAATTNPNGTGTNTESSANGRWGSKSLDPFSVSLSGSTPAFLFTFSQPIKTFSILVGDYGDSNPLNGVSYNPSDPRTYNVGDTDAIKLTAYNGSDPTKNIVKTATGSMPPGTLSGFASPFSQQRDTVSSNSTFTSVMVAAGLTSSGDNMSVYLDRLFFSTANTTVNTTVVDNEFNVGDSPIPSQSQPVIPEPATLGLLTLLAPALLRRRG